MQSDPIHPAAGQPVDAQQLPAMAEGRGPQRALVALGYKPADATRMVRAVAADGLPSEELIRRALAATGKLARAVYVERGTMERTWTTPLADKNDDDAPYFSIVLVPGWEGRP